MHHQEQRSIELPIIPVNVETAFWTSTCRIFPYMDSVKGIIGSYDDCVRNLAVLPYITERRMMCKLTRNSIGHHV